MEPFTGAVEWAIQTGVGGVQHRHQFGFTDGAFQAVVEDINFESIQRSLDLSTWSAGSVYCNLIIPSVGVTYYSQARSGQRSRIITEFVSTVFYKAYKGTDSLD